MAAKSKRQKVSGVGQATGAVGENLLVRDGTVLPCCGCEVKGWGASEVPICDCRCHDVQRIMRRFSA